MTLKNALDYFKRLVSETNNKSEIKVYQEFIHILSSLEESNLPETEIQSIETVLDAHDLSSTNKNHLNKVLKQFKKKLRDSFSLTTRGYYTNIGIILGSSFGAVFGILFLSNLERSLGISLGIAIGMLFGLIIGRNLDAQAKASGKMI